MIWIGQLSTSARGFTYLPLERFHALDLGPLEVVQNSCTMQQHVASFFEEPTCAIGLGLFQLHEPFSCLLLPVAAHHLSVEGHVFPQTPNVADLVEVFVDVRCIGADRDQHLAFCS